VRPEEKEKDEMCLEHLERRAQGEHAVAGIPFLAGRGNGGKDNMLAATKYSRGCEVFKERGG